MYYPLEVYCATFSTCALSRRLLSHAFTSYGAYCSSTEAVNRIYEIKGRKHTSPLAICVGDVSDIRRFAITDHLPHGLLDCLLPGPVTVVLSRGL